MEIPGSGKSPNSSLSFRYNANNEELEELYGICDEESSTAHCDASPNVQSENVSPKKSDKTSLIDKYFKSMRVERVEKLEDVKTEPIKTNEEPIRQSTPSKEVTSSPVKDYLNRLSKRNTSEVGEIKEGNETWKIFHDFKYKLTQAVEDMKSRSVEEPKDKSVVRDNSISDSEENSAIKELDLSVGDTDNQVSSLASSIQNLSEMTQPITTKVNEQENALATDGPPSDSTDDTHRNLDIIETIEIPKDLFDDSLEVESGVEAFEDTNIDGPSDVNQTDGHVINPVHIEKMSAPIKTQQAFPFQYQQNNSFPEDYHKTSRNTYFLTISMYILTFILLLSIVIFPKSYIWNGFLLGIWSFYVISQLQQWVLDKYFTDSDDKINFFRRKSRDTLPSTYTIPSVKEYKPLKKYESWINHYRSPEYDPYTYHINKTTTAFMKLEGCNLRISYTKTKVAKRALWDEKIDGVTFYQHRLYNLTGAKLLLLPKGLVSKRQWSKKYPICVVLSDKEKIQVLEKESSLERRTPDSVGAEKKKEQETESAETNTSPEKKKKFVWRKRDKSISHVDAEVGKEGLRHRLVRKMHRDKKTETVATSTETTTMDQGTEKSFDDNAFFDAESEFNKGAFKLEDEDIDETEINKIKDFLEDAEAESFAEGVTEGEWSVHVKPSIDKHSHLYLFARSGRDKLEWYRRLCTAINEATASSENSTEDKTNSETDKEKDKTDKDNKEGVAVYRVSDKDTVILPKPQPKADLTSESVNTNNSNFLNISEMDSYEKSFWPHLIKVMQSKGEILSSESSLLPIEMAWVNTVLARAGYDVMRDPNLIGKVQNRIQRKLNTLKLPSFMSPLIVTELSLAGACPFIEKVTAPYWDEKGIWLDADLRYEGGAFISILTQINLMKLKEKNISLEDQLLTGTDNIIEQDVLPRNSGGVFSEKQLRERKPAIFDSEVEDSAESSSDDENGPVNIDSNETFNIEVPTTSNTESGSSKKKFLRMVDKIATNKYFQQVTDYKYIKKAMEGLSNTDIKLQLEIHYLEGKLAVNLPPPPHDRVWVGFRTNPQLVLKARPAFGARALRFAHISNWIEQKLSKEFEKFLVLPNMEDFCIEIMTPTPVEFE